MTEPSQDQYRTRRRVARRTDLAASSIAGTAGAAFGSAKLRDEHAKQYSEAHKVARARLYRAAARVEQAATGSPVGARAAKLTTKLAEGHAGFKTLATGAAAGAVATGAGRYGDHLKTMQARAARRQREGVAKSQLSDGSYQPATSLTGRQRSVLRDEVKGGRKRTAVNANKPPAAAHNPFRSIFLDPGPKTQSQHRGVDAVYHGWGVQPGMKAAINAPTRPSKVHPNVHYGDSVGQHLERKLDRSLSTGQTSRLKHSVVFHHGETHPGAMAAAAGPHQVNGQRGHVILNRNMINEKGHLGGANGRVAGFNHVVNHELAHAAVKGKPFRFTGPNGEIKPKANLGEEARADATSVPRHGIYRRTHNVLPDPVARRLQHFAPEGTAQHDAFEAHQHYNATHRKVREAMGQPKPGVARDLLHTAGRRSRSPAVIAGAAIGGYSAYEHHRDKVGKAADVNAFGIVHPRVSVRGE